LPLRPYPLFRRLAPWPCLWLGCWSAKFTLALDTPTGYRSSDLVQMVPKYCEEISRILVLASRIENFTSAARNVRAIRVSYDSARSAGAGHGGPLIHYQKQRNGAVARPVRNENQKECGHPRSIRRFTSLPPSPASGCSSSLMLSRANSLKVVPNEGVWQ
jgi:hypothetical protein